MAAVWEAFLLLGLITYGISPATAICRQSCPCTFKPGSGCVEVISLLLTTSTRFGAESKGQHKLQITVNGAKLDATIPCNAVTNCAKGVTNTFEFKIGDFYPGKQAPCLKSNDITEVAIAAGPGSDNWQIQSIYTSFITCIGGVTATENRAFGKVIGNGWGSQKYAPLTPAK